MTHPGAALNIISVAKSLSQVTASKVPLATLANHKADWDTGSGCTILKMAILLEVKCLRERGSVPQVKF